MTPSGALKGEPPFALRPGTNDDVIYKSVVTENEYRVPDDLTGAIVVDIGVHVGAFSYLALTRGAASVYGFEPEPSNYARACENLAPFGERVQLSNRAVWRSDAPASQLHFFPSTDRANTGGGTLIWDTDGPMVDAAPLDQVIEEVTGGGYKNIDLLKIDCEGAEFPILLTSRLLDRIDRIVGEYHELRAQPPAHAAIPAVGEFTLDVLVAGLERAGFKVESQRQATGTYGDLGLFFARRPSN